MFLKRYIARSGRILNDLIAFEILEPKKKDI